MATITNHHLPSLSIIINPTTPAECHRLRSSPFPVVFALLRGHSQAQAVLVSQLQGVLQQPRGDRLVAPNESKCWGSLCPLQGWVVGCWGWQSCWCVWWLDVLCGKFGGRWFVLIDANVFSCSWAWLEGQPSSDNRCCCFFSCCSLVADHSEILMIIVANPVIAANIC